MISSVAGGPSTVQSGTIYAMLKGVALRSYALYCLGAPALHDEVPGLHACRRRL